MADRLKITTQGVNVDLTQADGDYDFGIAGGVGIIKNQEQPIMKMLGVVIILATLSFGRWLFRVVRGAKPSQTGAPSGTDGTRTDTSDHDYDGFDMADDWDDGGE